LIPAELVDSVSRRIMACLSYQIVRLSLQTNEEAMLRRVMLSELPINTRKWRKYAQFVIKKGELSEADAKLREEQQEKLRNGETVPEEEIIDAPDSYEEKEFRLEEFEVEGKAFEELLLSMGNYTDVARAKGQRWKDLLGGLQGQITNGAETVEGEQNQITGLAEFWEGVKTTSAMAQLNTMLASADKSKRHLEFCCKCVRRAMELPDVNLEELATLLEEKLGVPEELKEAIYSLLEQRVSNLE
jgi:hypothetical protein